jgi:hypothetical protein
MEPQLNPWRRQMKQKMKEKLFDVASVVVLTTTSWVQPREQQSLRPGNVEKEFELTTMVNPWVVNPEAGADVIQRSFRSVTKEEESERHCRRTYLEDARTSHFAYCTNELRCASGDDHGWDSGSGCENDDCVHCVHRVHCDAMIAGSRGNENANANVNENANENANENDDDELFGARNANGNENDANRASR